MARKGYCKVTFLVEDTVHCPGLFAEHGLAVLVEWEGNLVLFDTGQTDLLLRNAEAMSIELKGVSKVVLSHAHYDHTGGLLPLLKRARKATVFAHPMVFDKKYISDEDGIPREIGIPYSRVEVERACAALRFSVLPTEIVPGVFVTGEIARRTTFEEPESDFLAQIGFDERPDRLFDDQALVVDAPWGLFVLLGCAHAGVINTLRHVREMFPRRRIAWLAGGMHLLRSSEERLRLTVDTLKKSGVRRIFAGHCTGSKPCFALSNEFGERFSLLSTGTVLEAG